MDASRRPATEPTKRPPTKRPVDTAPSKPLAPCLAAFDCRAQHKQAYNSARLRAPSQTQHDTSFAATFQHGNGPGLNDVALAAGSDADRASAGAPWWTSFLNFVPVNVLQASVSTSTDI